ncbi:RNA polymerase sigma factor [Chitinimonas sp. BJYL2]|uniref:RNA polymerase sigma factor n=1 Tax=Chitinimonas sp. BJYL2 TaxID=2976696 RepID=UPI0022B3278D|nr:RNA polymerase sigma factor [Chitinimonas sp. BJYL2]
MRFAPYYTLRHSHWTMLDYATDPCETSNSHAADLHSATMQHADDAALMLAYAAGDAAAFERLYALHRQGLYGFLHRQAPRAVWVDDLFQEAWLAVVKARADYRPEAAFKTWLYGIARNKLIDRIRQQEPTLLADFAGHDDDTDPLARLPASAANDPVAVLDKLQTGQALDIALRTLPAVQREAFLLREHAGMELDAIAALTGVNMETAKSRLRYAVAKLKTALAPLGEQV